MQVVTAAGIEFEVVHLWLEATRSDERRLKNMHNHADHCPICTPTLRRGRVTHPAPIQYMLPF